MARPALSAVLLLCLVALPAGAQQNRILARADTLFRNGRVFAAETLYYYAARREPRNPAARLALGRYLAARGALKIGAVLMEEARYFGGDPKTVAAHLAPVYVQLGDWKSLVGLPGSPLPYAERARAEWLRDNAPAVEGPDSASVAYLPAETGSLGRLRIAIGRDTLTAAIDPRTQGLVLDTAWLRRKETKHFASTFDADRRNFAGVTRQVALGPMTLVNVPTRYEVNLGARTARVGLDLLGKFAPRFDPAHSAIMLRKSGRIAEPAAGERIATLAFPTGLWIVASDGMWPIQDPETHPLLRGVAWTLYPRRGEILVER